MALVGVELETLVSEPDALTTRPPPCAQSCTVCSRLKALKCVLPTRDYRKITELI